MAVMLVASNPALHPAFRVGTVQGLPVAQKVRLICSVAVSERACAAATVLPMAQRYFLF
jgi:hypothetical protein